jgi:hypothetical protein
MQIGNQGFLLNKSRQKFEKSGTMDQSGPIWSATQTAIVIYESIHDRYGRDSNLHEGLISEFLAIDHEQGTICIDFFSAYGMGKIRTLHK